MVKAKKSSSDNVRQKKKTAEVRPNPFEVKFNKQHHNVLGRKMMKNDKGRPGVARNRAMKKRKETLLVEYQKRGKVNQFIDRRIGENDPNLSVEDKMLKRFAAERQKTQEKSSIFSLNDEEELTHYGQSLSEIEKFEDAGESESEDEDEGRLGAKFVSEEHFGGFFTKKEFEDHQSKKSWKERMEEVISQSKRAKYEKQKLKEEALQLTNKLDDDFNEIRMLMAKTKKSKDKAEESNKPQKDDYDITVRELMYELKGKATDRLKSEEEIAKEEQERLEQLESDRLRRMRGITEEEALTEQSQMRSADDLDDGFTLDTSVQPRFHVGYKDGKMLKAEDEKDDDAAEDEENAGGDDDAGDEEDENAEDGGEEEEEDEERTSEDEEEAGEDADSSEEDAMERMSDLESEEEECSDDEDEPPGKRQKSDDTKKSNKSNKPAIDLKARKEMMEAASKELPYTFTAPSSLDELLSLLDERSTSDQLTIITRLRKCHHPSLAEGNREKLQNIGRLLLEYFGFVAGDVPPDLTLLDRLTVHLYELTQQFPLAMGQCMVTLLKTRYLLMQETLEASGGKKAPAELDNLLYLKLVPVLFPSSDFKHPVATPAGLLMSQLLTQCPVRTGPDIAAGLFVCSLFLEYVSLSKRFVPEVVNFLHGLLFLASDKPPNKVEAVIPPFKPVGRHINSLVIESEEARSVQVAPLSVLDCLGNPEPAYINTDQFRLDIISATVKLIHKFAELYGELPAFREVFSPVRNQMKKLPMEKYPESLKDQVNNLSEFFASKDSESRPYLTYKKKKPKMFKQYEPKVEDSFDGKRKRGGNRDFNEKQRLIHKHKKELKGAAREIRKDNQFLAREALKDRMDRDAERMRKVREIQGLLSQQEGDFKALKRKKDQS